LVHSFQRLPRFDFTPAEPPAQRLTISLTSRSFWSAWRCCDANCDASRSWLSSLRGQVKAILRGCVRAWMSFASKNAIGCAAVAAHERHEARTAAERRNLRYI